MLIEIKNLEANIDNKNIINNINIDIKDNDTIAILGPNGHGKSTILKSIIGHYSFSYKGNIIYNKEEIINLNTYEITQKGIFYSNQNPIEIPGVSQLDLYKSILNSKTLENVKISELFLKINKNMKKLQFKEEILTRSVNVGFSGGEKKKNEILQMLLLDPKLILLDEIDSGLDIDVLNLICDILKQEQKNNKTIVFITHNKKMLNELKPNKILVVANGTIVKEGDILMANEIFDLGFKKYFRKENIVLEDKEKIILEGCKIESNSK